MVYSIQIVPSAAEELKGMRTSTIELDQFRQQLDQILAKVAHGDVIVTRQGKPWIILHAVSEALDAESGELAQSPEFWEMIQQRRREAPIPWEEAKRQLELD
jgi:prevent-host-death family protein